MIGESILHSSLDAKARADVSTTPLSRETRKRGRGEVWESETQHNVYGGREYRQGGRVGKRGNDNKLQLTDIDELERWATSLGG